MFVHVLKKLFDAEPNAQKRAAEATGISAPLLSQYASGKKNPTIEKLILLADYFDVTTDYLLGRETPPLQEIDTTLPPYLDTTEIRNDLNILIEIFKAIPEKSRDSLLEYAKFQLNQAYPNPGVLTPERAADIVRQTEDILAQQKKDSRKVDL